MKAGKSAGQVSIHGEDKAVLHLYGLCAQHLDVQQKINEKGNATRDKKTIDTKSEARKSRGTMVGEATAASYLEVAHISYLR